MAKRRRAHPTKKGRRKRAKPRQRSVMILECDSEKLASDGITAAGDAARHLSLLFETTYVRARSKDQLQGDLANHVEAGARPRVVIVVGHANKEGIRLAADHFAPWGAFAKWLEPFDPAVVLILGCEAGSWLPCKALFGSIKGLTDLYASPLKLNQQQFPLWEYAFLHLWPGAKLPKDANQFLRAFNFGHTGGVILHRTRKDFENTGIEEAVMQNVIEVGLAKVQKLWAAFKARRRA